MNTPLNERARHMAALTSAVNNIGRMKRFSAPPALAALLVAGSLSLGGCAAVSGDTMDKTLQAIGLQKPAVPDGIKDLPSIPTHRPVTLRLHAGAVLNTDAAGRPLATVVRIYRLKNTELFLQSPYEAFHSDTTSGAVVKPPPFERDILEMREVVLAPGQQAESIEKLGMDVSAIAVVALFRSPQSNRWRFVFDAKTAAATGITLGLHACAMSVAQGQPLGVLPEALRVAGVRCQ